MSAWRPLCLWCVTAVYGDPYGNRSVTCRQVGTPGPPYPMQLTALGGPADMLAWMVDKRQHGYEVFVDGQFAGIEADTLIDGDPVCASHAVQEFTLRAQRPRC